MLRFVSVHCPLQPSRSKDTRGGSGDHSEGEYRERDRDKHKCSSPPPDHKKDKVCVCVKLITKEICTKLIFLLRKIALPYPHKCLFGFVEQNVSTDKNFLRNILVTRGDPFVCACPRLRSSRCRQTIVERSSLYFWSI